MIESFTEDCSFHIAIGILTILFFGWLYNNTGEKKLLYVIVGALVLTVGVFLTERFITTEREQLQAEIYELANAVENNNPQRILESVDKSMKQTINRINHELPSYHFELCNVIGLPDVMIEPDDPERAIVEFTVHVRVSGRETGEGQRRVQLFYQKMKSGAWKIFDYHHFDPRESLSL